MRNPADLRPWVIGRLLDIDDATNRASVSIDGGPAVWLPFVANVYTGITTVFIQRDPHNTGAGQYVTGPCGSEADTTAYPPAPPTPGTPATVEVTVVIRPTWSGTYRQIRNAWDRWNVTRHGGRATLYQGDEYDSGELTGLAVYGSQITALGAVSISRVVVSTPIATGSGSVQLQGAPHATRPSGGPVPAGETATGTTSVTLTPAMREALRTGTARALATVGATYRGTYGTSQANGMALAVTYTREA